MGTDQRKRNGRVWTFSDEFASDKSCLQSNTSEDKYFTGYLAVNCVDFKMDINY